MFIDNLKLIIGFIENDRFIMRGILGNAVLGSYRADGLISIARLIQEGEPLKLVFDKELCISIPIDLNLMLREEIITICNYLCQSDVRNDM
jgi:hypothetical protein